MLQRLPTSFFGFLRSFRKLTGLRQWLSLGVWTAPTSHDLHVLGLSREKAERVLDVENISVSENRRCLRIAWSGLGVSDADETYHARWSNVEGEEVVLLEDMEVVEVNQTLDKTRPLSEKDWLATVRIEPKRLK